MNKTLGLSLSGGGAKSLIYLGIIKALREEKLPISVIGGLSGGALIAGLIGCGKSIEEIIEIATETKFSRLIDINYTDGVEILDHKKVYKLLKELIGDARIEDCNPKVLIFATDIEKQKALVLDKGELASAMIASSALPPLFKIYKREGKQLTEGGFTVHYGAKYFRKAGADVVIGSDVNGFANVKFPGAINDLFLGIATAVSVIAEYEQKKDPVDIKIENFNDDTGLLEFKKMSRELVNIGYERTKKHIPEIKNLLK